MAQIALAWAGQKVVSPIVGTNGVERLKESIVTEIMLTPEEVNYLEGSYAFFDFLCHVSLSPLPIDMYQSLFVVTSEG